MKQQVSITINGELVEAEVEPRTLLAYFLREEAGLTGTHVGCDSSNCGCCVVVLDGDIPVKSCTMFAVMASGRSVETVEGMAKGGVLHPLQQAFWDQHGLQCGFCTPGMMMMASAMLKHYPNPTDGEVRQFLAGNLCRCTGYNNIVKAVQQAAWALAAEGEHAAPVQDQAQMAEAAT